MKIKFQLLLLLCIPFFGNSQSNSAECEWTIPLSIHLDCQHGQDYQFITKCSCEMKKFELKIYNRWGNILFESKDNNEIWNACEANSGTYFWTIHGQFRNGEKFEKEGHVTLIK